MSGQAPGTELHWHRSPTPHALSVRLISPVDLYLPLVVLLIPKLTAKSHSCLLGRVVLLPRNCLLPLPRAVNVSFGQGLP